MRSTLRKFLSSIHLGSRPPNSSTTSQTADPTMVTQGVGSISSPIVISDDEDEAMIDLQLRVDSDSVDGDQSDRPRTPPNGNSEEISTASKGYAMALNMGYCPGRGLGRGLDGRVEPVCLEVGQKRKRVDSGIGFQRCQLYAPGWSPRKGDGKLNKKQRKEQHMLGAPQRVFRSQQHYMQPKLLAAPTGPANTNQGPWVALSSSRKGKERERLTAPSPPKPAPSPVRRLPAPPQGPRSNFPYSPPLPTASPPKGPRSWLASQAQAQSPPMAPQTPPIAPRTPPTAPRAMQQQQQQQHLTTNGYAGPSAIACPVPQPGYPQIQTQPQNSYVDGQPTSIPSAPQSMFPQMQQQQSQGVVYNPPFAGAPVPYYPGVEPSESWHTQYSMVTVAAPPPPPTYFIAYPDYSNPGGYTYVPVPTVPAGYTPAPAPVDPYATAAAGGATGQKPSSGLTPVTADASTSAAGFNQSNGCQPISTADPDHDDKRSDSSTPEPPSSRKPFAESMRRPRSLHIGHAPEADPNSKTGTYVKRLASQPNPSCTLVLDSIPMRFRNPSWVHKWAVNAGEAEPVCIDVDAKSGKALVEFVDSASARKAFQSKQLKGKGKHAIRVWWYRVTGVGSNAGVGEIEEGEVEDGSTKKGEPIAQLSKKQKKKLQRKQQVTPNLQAGSGGAQVTASEDTAVDEQAHAPSIERKGASVDAVAPRGRRFSFDDFSVRFEVSSGSQDGIGVGHCIQEDDDEDRASIASSRPPSTQLVISHDNRGEDVEMSSPVVASHMPGDSLSASEVCGDQSATVDPSRSVDVDVDFAVAFVSADNGLPPALDSEVTRLQQDINPAEVPAMASRLPSPEPQPVCSDSPINSNLPSSLLSTETPADESVEQSHSAKVMAPASQKELEEDITSSESTRSIELTPLASASAMSSSPSQVLVPLAREPSVDKIALEMNLRRLVRESKQNRANTHSATSSPTSTHTTPLPPATSAVSGDVALAQPSPSVSSAASLEELAVTFISETIESVKPAVLRTTAPLNTRQELIQKQLKLEQYISQSKELIAQLSRAQSKEEKETIMSAMRQWSRLMELDSVGVQSKGPVATSRFCWPCSCEETVLVISDDEDEE
ncbi:hypothetical protein DFH29DRAFT_945439 [Suillus ampliporus]|nr:hypothetical protein DFH29DRAFT_945439 [Suillus ampliporus]